jgi:hypothetical protein
LTHDRRQFERLGLLDDAALATIDLVESLTIAGQTAEVGRLCSDAMRYTRRAGNRRQALIAAAYDAPKEAVATTAEISVETMRSQGVRIDSNGILGEIPKVAPGKYRFCAASYCAEGFLAIGGQLTLDATH